MYNGRPFQALDVRLPLTQPSATCKLVYITGVTAAPSPSLPHSQPLLSHSEPWPVISPADVEKDASLHALLPYQASSPLRTAAYELPTCPVCLDRLDATVSGLITGICQHTFHCNCLQRWTDSRCPVCRYTQTPALDENHASSSSETASRATNCEQCGSSTDLWVCLICAHVGCGRYKQGHAREHFAETGHLYSLELETQRVWDYAGDGYVHRLIQSKSDGKLVELPSASSVAAATPEQVWNARYPGTVQARSALPNMSTSADASASSHPNDMHLLEEKMHALGLEYSSMIMSQLDSQRIYYEGLLAVARSERAPREETEQIRSDYASLQAKYQQGEARCAELQNELVNAHAQATRYETQLRRALESARALKKERDEEKSVSDGLYKHVEKLQEEQKALQTRVADLSEELRDVMFYVSARDKVQEMDQVLPAEESLHGGAAYVPDPPTKPSNASRKAKGRRP
ncbi:hypothetical protein CBS14141_001114 [Malassezia furfur]|nr:hypothetical protein CBS14141_001114 [Malassezia furfur]